MKVTETAQCVLENDVNNNIEGLWEEFKTKIYSISCETLGLRKMKTTKKKITPWWSDEVRTAVKEKMRSFRRWMKTRNVLDRENYVNARNQAKVVKRKSKTESWEKIGEDLLQDVCGTKKL